MAHWHEATSAEKYVMAAKVAKRLCERWGWPDDDSEAARLGIAVVMGLCDYVPDAGSHPMAVLSALLPDDGIRTASIRESRKEVES